MSDLKKYIKIAKGITIQPADEHIEDKIIERISKVSDRDRTLLDEKFLGYIKKHNSRLYLFTENIKNNPLRFSMLLAGLLLIVFIIFYELKKLDLFSSEQKTYD